jgi:hypothetical protein
MKDIEDEPITAMNFYSNTRGEIFIAVALKGTERNLP